MMIKLFEDGGLSLDMDEEDLLTFEKIRNVRKEERENDTLADIDEDFFEKVEDYLASKKRISSKKSNREFENAKTMVEDIIDNRLKKVMRYSFLSTKTKIPTDNMINGEIGIYKTIGKKLKERRETLLKTIDPEKTNEKNVDLKDREVERSNSTEKKEVEEKGEEVLFEGSSLVEDENKEKELSKIEVKVLEKVEEFLGTDMKVYGPYEEEEIVELDKEIGDILVKQGKVEKID